MTLESAEVDRQTRVLIQASEPVLRHWLGVARLDQALIGTIYVSQRKILAHWHVTTGRDDRSQEQLVEQLAVSMYLTAAAWQTAAQPDVSLLASLREIVAAGLPPPAVIGMDQTEGWV